MANMKLQLQIANKIIDTMDRTMEQLRERLTAEIQLSEARLTEAKILQAEIDRMNRVLNGFYFDLSAEVNYDRMGVGSA